MKIEEILQDKGHDVVTIEEFRSVLDAARVLVDRNIGALVVTEGESPTGILTERDILRVTARSPGELDSIHVATVMTESKIRHLPVVEGGRLVGIVSIGDLLNACRVVAEEENSYLRQYIQGAG